MLSVNHLFKEPCSRSFKWNVVFRSNTPLWICWSFTYSQFHVITSFFAKYCYTWLVRNICLCYWHIFYLCSFHFKCRLRKWKNYGSITLLIFFFRAVRLIASLFFCMIVSIFPYLLIASLLWTVVLTLGETTAGEDGWERQEEYWRGDEDRRTDQGGQFI